MTGFVNAEQLYFGAMLFLAAVAPIVLLSLLFVTAPYGRHHRRGFGPSMNNKLAWVVMELPALLIVPTMLISAGIDTSWLLTLLLLWGGHYAYRTLYFPFRIRGARNNFPVTIMLMAVVFNSLNGFINGYALTAAEAGWREWNGLAVLGVGLFIGGFLLHSRSDHTLLNLRRPGGPRYQIPMGGAFRWVSSPHYLGEIIQWVGWALVAGTLAGWVFALFTLANLLPRAIANQRWYRRTFADYPAERKALIPGLF